LVRNCFHLTYKISSSIYLSPFSMVCKALKSRVRVMVLNATFKNISVISWWSVVLVEETGVSGENHRPVGSHWQTLSHNVLSNTPRHDRDLNWQLQWWYALIAQVVVNPITIRSLPRKTHWNVSSNLCLILIIFIPVSFCTYLSKQTEAISNLNIFRFSN
jgi:hypothetical protein